MTAQVVWEPLGVFYLWTSPELDIQIKRENARVIISDSTCCKWLLGEETNIPVFSTLEWRIQIFFVDDGTKNIEVGVFFYYITGILLWAWLSIMIWDPKLLLQSQKYVRRDSRIRRGDHLRHNVSSPRGLALSGTTSDIADSILQNHQGRYFSGDASTRGVSFLRLHFRILAPNMVIFSNKWVKLI